jgi:cytoskeletal protein CcmA (bactofilin family)
MRDLTIDGISKIEGGEYGTLKIDGMATCKGNLSAEAANVDGMFTGEGDVSVGTFVCDGMAKIRGNVKAGKLEVNGMLKIDGIKLEADEISCDGMIKLRGEISADVIKADGCIDAEEITGDSIYVRSHRHFFHPFFHHAGSRIKLIEATTVDLREVVAESVNGKDVRIGRGCRIDSIDCSGTLMISPWARVGTVTGDYETVRE